MGDWKGNDKTPQLPDGLTRKKKIGQRTPGSETFSCRAGDKRPRHQQTVPQFLSQQWIPSVTNVEVSGTMLHSALAEEEEEEEEERREKKGKERGQERRKAGVPTRPMARQRARAKGKGWSERWMLDVGRAAFWV